MIKKDSAIVLLSGGQDSTTCLFWAKNNFEYVEALGFNYGQRHIIELSQAQVIARKAGINFTVYDIRGTLSGSSLTEHDKSFSDTHERNANLPSSFLPGRNALFLTMAAGYAYNKGVFDLVGGMCETDYSGYPDCRRTFLDSMQISLSLALEVDIRIHTLWCSPNLGQVLGQFKLVLLGSRIVLFSLSTPFVYHTAGL